MNTYDAEAVLNSIETWSAPDRASNQLHTVRCAAAVMRPQIPQRPDAEVESDPEQKETRHHLGHQTDYLVAENEKYHAL
jgi:hypothetical protein